MDLTTCGSLPGSYMSECARVDRPCIRLLYHVRRRRLFVAFDSECHAYQLSQTAT